MNYKITNQLIKKIFSIFLMVFLLIFLSSCFGTSDEGVEDAKKELGIIEVDNSDIDSGTNIGMENSNSGFIEEEEKAVEISNLTQEQFIELDDISENDIEDGQIEITGKTIADVDKIVVSFSNDTSDFPTDTYTLKQFSPGDKTFMYRAFKKYETLDYGKNIYLFEAYSGDNISKLELTINFKKEGESTSTGTVEESFGSVSTDTLPSSTKYGTPVELGNGDVTYTDLKGLEISKYENSNLTCESLSQELSSVINGWFYWNTCRPVSGEEGISFYVIRLDGDNYVYEKHYFLQTKGLYGVQELENGTGVNIDNIGDKNQELKEKNSEFEITQVSDSLFKEILNQ